jgi:hypothetical protein
MENGIQIQISKLVIVAIAVVFFSIHDVNFTLYLINRSQRQRRLDMLQSSKLTRSAKLR